VRSVLESQVFDERLFPRRPSLIQKLLQTVSDADAGPARLAAIVAQDPMLAADVLRLANSAFYRVTPQPVESLQRAVVLCGSNGLQSLITTLIMRPEFRPGRAAFARFSTVLWERTARAAVAAETYAAATRRDDRPLAQLACLLGALGPLLIYRTVIDAYAKAPGLEPHPALLLDLIEGTGPQISRRIALAWKLPARVVAALGVMAGERIFSEDARLAAAIHWGELLGSLSALELEKAISEDDAHRIATAAGLAPELFTTIRTRMQGPA
jgi:HD-like signal output (HDOD) protein